MIDILDRLRCAASANSDAELARKFGISQQSIAKARTTKSVPASWLLNASKLFHVSIDWLYYGSGPMRPSEAVHTVSNCVSLTQPAPDVPLAASEKICAACANLKRELELERQERRQLTAEIRNLTGGVLQSAAENRKLWEKNAALREENATLRERQYQRSGQGDSEPMGHAG